MEYRRRRYGEPSGEHVMRCRTLGSQRTRRPARNQLIEKAPGYLFRADFLRPSRNATRVRAHTAGHQFHRPSRRPRRALHCERRGGQTRRRADVPAPSKQVDRLLLGARARVEVRGNTAKEEASRNYGQRGLAFHQRRARSRAVNVESQRTMLSIAEGRWLTRTRDTRSPRETQSGTLAHISAAADETSDPMM